MYVFIKKGGHYWPPGFTNRNNGHNMQLKRAMLTDNRTFVRQSFGVSVIYPPEIGFVRVSTNDKTCDIFIGQYPRFRTIDRRSNVETGGRFVQSENATVIHPIKNSDI